MQQLERILNIIDGKMRLAGWSNMPKRWVLM